MDLVYNYLGPRSGNLDHPTYLKVFIWSWRILITIRQVFRVTYLLNELGKGMTSLPVWPKMIHYPLYVYVFRKSIPNAQLGTVGSSVSFYMMVQVQFLDVANLQFFSKSKLTCLKKDK